MCLSFTIIVVIGFIVGDWNWIYKIMIGIFLVFFEAMFIGAWYTVKGFWHAPGSEEFIVWVVYAALLTCMQISILVTIFFSCAKCTRKCINPKRSRDVEKV